MSPSLSPALLSWTPRRGSRCRLSEGLAPASHIPLQEENISKRVRKIIVLTLHRDNDGGSEAQAELLLAPRGGGGRGCRLEHVVHVDHLPPAAVVVHQIIQSDRVAPEVSGACQEDNVSSFQFIVVYNSPR